MEQRIKMFYKCIGGFKNEVDKRLDDISGREARVFDEFLCAVDNVYPLLKKLKKLEIEEIKAQQQDVEACNVPSIESTD